MKRTVQTIIKRLFISIVIIFFIRIGNFIPIPEINHFQLAQYIETNSLTKSLINTFSSEDTVIIGLFTLNIFPYINASIFVQLIIAFSPPLSALQKEGGSNARRSLNRLTRFITLIWAIIQSVSLSLYLRPIFFDWNLLFFCNTAIWLTTGAMIVLWLSEIITDYGLGNGASLLIYINIVSNLPNLYKNLLQTNIENLTRLALLKISIMLFLSLLGIILLQDGTRLIPLLSSKQLKNITNSQEIAFYLPLRFNQAGVMPIVITASLLVIPNYLITLGILPSLNFKNLQIFSNLIYWTAYFLLILFFSSFYSKIILNPKDISNQLQKMAVVIPGIRSGLETTFYLKKVMGRLNFLGTSVLAIVATFPNLLEVILNVSNLKGLSTTSLLIMTGVLVDISKEVDEIIYSNIYKK